MKIFHRPEQSCSSSTSFSPSAGKPALVVADWLSIPDIAERIEVVSFEPVTRDILYQAHSKEHVDGVLDGTKENGFGNTNPDIAKSLPYTCGSMLAAAKYVVEESNGNRRVGPNFACSPTSGFHHAGYDYGEGFCTLNGLMVTAIEMQRLGLAKKILILDYDQHYGDGTDDIIKHLGIKNIKHITANKSYKTAEKGLRLIHDLMLLEPHAYDLVLYQAGADIHVDDPLGGRMTTQEMYYRDARVFEACTMRGLPLVWNLAGGYQRDASGSIEPVLSLHRQTMEAGLRCGG